MVSAYLVFLEANQPTHTNPKYKDLPTNKKVFPVGLRSPNRTSSGLQGPRTISASLGNTKGTRTNNHTELRIRCKPTSQYLGVSPFLTLLLTTSFIPQLLFSSSFFFYPPSFTRSCLVLPLLLGYYVPPGFQICSPIPLQWRPRHTHTYAHTHTHALHTCTHTQTTNFQHTQPTSTHPHHQNIFQNHTGSSPPNHHHPRHHHQHPTNRHGQTGEQTGRIH